MARQCRELQELLRKSEACMAEHFFHDPFTCNLPSEEVERELRKRFQHVDKDISIFNLYNVFDSKFLEMRAWFIQNRMRGFFEVHPSPALLLKEFSKVGVSAEESYFGTFKGISVLYQASSCGIVIKDSIGEVLFRGSYNVGNCTTLQAEYCGLIYMLLIGTFMGVRRFLICGDDKVIIYHMLGYCKVPNKFLQLLYSEAQTLVRNYARVGFKLIPKYLNEDADVLAQQGLQRRAQP